MTAAVPWDALDKSDCDNEDSDIAWVRWLEAREEVAAENADRMVELIEKRRTL